MELVLIFNSSINLDRSQLLAVLNLRPIDQLGSTGTYSEVNMGQRSYNVVWFLSYSVESYISSFVMINKIKSLEAINLV